MAQFKPLYPCISIDSNTYLIDQFLGKELSDLNKYLIYTHSDAELQDFAGWLSEFVISQNFHQYANEFIEIEKRLKSEPVGIIRSQLVSRKEIYFTSQYRKY